MISYASAHLPASLSSVGLLIQPLTAAVTAWIIFHVTIDPIQMAGAALLLWGIYLPKRGNWRKREAPGAGITIPVFPPPFAPRAQPG